jgi:hypothetical protein
LIWPIRIIACTKENQKTFISKSTTALSMWCPPNELLLPCGDPLREFVFCGVRPVGLLLLAPFGGIFVKLVVAI